MTKTKKLSNPFSTGSGGPHFEAHVQASFVALMLSGGYAPGMPCWPITEVKLQGKIDGFDTDDLIVYAESSTGARSKLLGQVKHSIRFTSGDEMLAEVMQAAWNDFNNEQLFDTETDVIALVTGPLSATDSHNVVWLLDQARHTKNAEEFYRNVEKSHFSPPKSVEKLQVIQHHLKNANAGVDVAPERVYLFLNRFRLLGYDLGKELGVVLSLLQSHISQFNQQHPELVWSRIVEFVQTWNQDAGTIVLEKVPEDLRAIFKPPGFAQIPQELAYAHPEQTPTDWSSHRFATDLALATLAGSWNEENSADRAFVEGLTTQGYATWIAKLREILLLPNSPVSLRNGTWEILERSNLWEVLGSRIFDQHLDSFLQLAVDVLAEIDPAFDLPVEERYAAAIHNKVLKASRALRKGIAEGLALIGARSSALINCSTGRAERTAVLALRQLFANADWKLWGSLNTLLPPLAETSPSEFLAAVEHSLNENSTPFDSLFSQEGTDVGGRNYMTGLLWALEAIAWEENFLVRVCVALGDLASHDPGGTWSNRPSNSLTTILLPWKPQTSASIEKRKVAVQILCKERPEVGWVLLMTLLPNQHQMTSGTYKPRWRNPLSAKELAVTNGEYWDQVIAYGELAVSMASGDLTRLGVLVDRFANLPKPANEQVLNILSSTEFASLPENQRVRVWDRLMKLTNRHRKFANAAWALSPDLLAAVEVVRDQIAPSSPTYAFRYLFTDSESDLFEETGNWEEQRGKLQARRDKVIEEMLFAGGVESVLDFAKDVKSPTQVGHSLGTVGNASIDAALLPRGLRSDDRRLVQLVGGYVWSRRFSEGLTWTDSLDRSSWHSDDVGQFLSLLPFDDGAWDRADEWLGVAQGEYWTRANVNPYVREADLGRAVGKLIEHGRPRAAIDCLVRMSEAKKPLNVAHAVGALGAAVSSNESANTLDTYRILELIKILQADSSVSEADLFGIEWAYVQLLDRHDGAAPVTLYRRLADDPEFFCQLIGLVYRSNFDVVSENAPEDDMVSTLAGTHLEVEEDSPDEGGNSSVIANNAWRVLHEWDVPPGLKGGGSFDTAHFSAWLARVRESCAASGHLEVALMNVGEVLFHAPSDPDGLWMDRAAAEALNARDADDMREGYRTAAYNSRGLHWVDPTGKPERELAQQYRQKAEDIENAGFQRFAATLKALAESYEREAERGGRSGG